MWPGDGRRGCRAFSPIHYQIPPHFSSFWQIHFAIWDINSWKNTLCNWQIYFAIWTEQNLLGSHRCNFQIRRKIFSHSRSHQSHRITPTVSIELRTMRNHALSYNTIKYLPEQLDKAHRRPTNAIFRQVQVETWVAPLCDQLDFFCIVSHREACFSCTASSMLWLCGVTVRRILSTAPLRLSFFLFFRPLFSRLLFPFLWSSSSPMLLLPSSHKIKKSFKKGSQFWLILCKRRLFYILLINFPGGVFCKVCSYGLRKEVKGYILASNEFTLVSAILDIVLLTI